MIREAWREAVPPGRRVVRDCFEVEPQTALYSLGPVDTQRWLSGKRWDEIVREDQIEVEMPFYYLTPEASAYFLGGYLLSVSEILEHECVDLSAIHFYAFLRDELFERVLPILSDAQRDALLQSLLNIIECSKLFRLSDRDSGGLRRAAEMLSIRR